jgi:hypothetical protein
MRSLDLGSRHPTWAILFGVGVVTVGTQWNALEHQRFSITIAVERGASEDGVWSLSCRENLKRYTSKVIKMYGNLTSISKQADFL